MADSLKKRRRRRRIDPGEEQYIKESAKRYIAQRKAQSLKEKVGGYPVESQEYVEGAIRAALKFPGTIAYERRRRRLTQRTARQKVKHK